MAGVRLSLALVLLVLVAVVPLNAAPAPADVTLRDYVHTSWTQHDGEPLRVYGDLAQSNDGFLWIVTRDQGLLRFDGMRFVSVPTPCTKPETTVRAAPDGGVWIYCGGRVVRGARDGRFVVVPQSFEGRAIVATRWVVVDSVGQPWIFAETIRHLDSDGRNERELPRPSAEFITGAAVDFEGTPWVSDGQQVIRMHAGGHETFPIKGVMCLTMASNGEVLATNTTHLWRLRPGAAPTRVAAPPGVRFSNLTGSMAEAPDGSVWIGTRQHGIARLQDGRIETFADIGDRDRLVSRVLVDREGTIWAASGVGLHRFRTPMVKTAPAASRYLTGTPGFVFVDSRADLWLSPGADMEAVRVSPADGRGHAVRTREGASPDAVGEDATGRIWLSDGFNIGYVDRGRFVPVRDAGNAPIANVWALQTDAAGRLWALAEDVGLYQVTPGPPKLVIRTPDAGVRFLVSSRFGTWIGLSRGALEQHIDGRTHTYRHERENESIRSFVEDGDSLWIGTFRGLRRWRHGTWTAWTREHGLPGDGVINEIAADRSGHLWLMTSGGLLMLARAELDAVPDGQPRPLSFARIGLLDGVLPHPGGMRPSPRVAIDRAGRLYFTTVDSVVTVDPSVVDASTLAPPIVLESVRADDRPLDLAATSRLVEPSRLQFDYTSLSLRSPENARFRYRLDGYDRDWIDAGSQRHVTYGTLKPGAYRFRVIGAGSEGVWNQQGASVSFVIAPVFWRTWWFQLSLVLFGLSVAAGLHRLRVHQLTRRFEIGLDARVRERTRIARELHDTLLQSFQGVVIHFQAATNLLPGRPDEARRRFETVLDQAARAITEGRDAVQNLRSSTGAADDLPHAISVLAGELLNEDAGATPPEVRVNVEGMPRPLRAILRDDIYRIVSEAIRNALRHGQARVIQVDIHYDERHLRVRVRDDGRGIDPAVLEARGAVGHWGLPGMRERADLMGGTFDVRSRVGSGTEVELSLPASKAYATFSRRRGWSARGTRTEAGA